MIEAEVEARRTLEVEEGTPEPRNTLGTLESRKPKKTGSSLEPPEGMQPCQPA